jgi:glucokinase
MASIFFIAKKSDIDITANTYSLPDDAVSSAFLWIRRVYIAGCATTGIAIRQAGMTLQTDLPVLVYDVGGSHVSAALCRQNPPIVGPVSRSESPPEISAETFFQTLHFLGVRASGGVYQVGGAQLAVPAPFDYETGISRMTHKLPHLYGVDLRDALATLFGWLPEQVRFMHDSAAFLLGELTAGAAHGAERAVGITLGTGIGSSFSVSGKVIAHGFGIPPSGEIWNLSCGDGTVEDLLSARAIQREYERRTGSNREVISIAASARDDVAARDTFIGFGRALGRALRTILSDFAPDVVVLGGGISHAAHLFLPATKSELAGTAFRLEESEMIDHAALVGAAAAWFNEGRISDGPHPDSVSTAAHGA